MIKLLTPVKEDQWLLEKIELEILDAFFDVLYDPLFEELKIKKSEIIKNSLSDLLNLIRTGQISYSDGKFTGRFNSHSSVELKRLGAKWDRKQGLFTIPFSKLPVDVKLQIITSKDVLARKINKIKQMLDDSLVDKILKRIKLGNNFQSIVQHTDKKIMESFKGITIKPVITKQEQEKINTEYTENMKMYIRDFAEKEITTLRNKVEKNAKSGLRYDQLVKHIKQSYGVTENKAKFLARQETNLFLVKYKESKYRSAGVDKYKWRCVVGSPLHPVRPMHKKLDGKIFKWTEPPVVDEQGNRKNAGEDYNCRCQAVPIVEF